MFNIRFIGACSSVLFDNTILWQLKPDFLFGKFSYKGPHLHVKLILCEQHITLFVAYSVFRRQGSFALNYKKSKF